MRVDPRGNYFHLAFEIDRLGDQRVTKRVQFVGAVLLLICDRVLLVCDLMLSFGEVQAILGLFHNDLDRLLKQCFFSTAHWATC